MPEVIASTYEILHKLGSGGGGNVYLAHHLRLDKKVVLKADKRKLSTPPELLRREVDVLKNLRHPHIPQVYDFFVENDTVYTVMDYIQGESLDRALARGERFSQARVIRWAAQLLDALVYLHSPTHGDPPKGFIHSDIKPANIMLLPDDTICLIDFNISLALGEENIIGCSAGYASPEHYGLDYSTNGTTSLVRSEGPTDQELTELAPNDSITLAASGITGGHVKTVTPDVRSDIYSVGATLYHLFSGVRPPRDAREVQALTDGQVSPLVSAILCRAMQPNPDLRYQTAGEMLADFVHLRDRDPRAIRLRRARRLAFAACVAVLGAGVLLAFTGLKRMQTTESWLKLAEYSANALAAGDVQAAVDYALQAIPTETGPWTPSPVPQAQKALTDALGVYDLADSFRSHGSVALPAAPLYLALSPDGRWAACLYSGAVALVDTGSCRITATLPADPSALAEVEFLGSDRLVYAGAEGLCVWDIARGEALWQGLPATGIAVSADGSRIAAVYRDETFATVYDAATGAVAATVDFAGRRQQVAVNDRFANPNDNLLALDAAGGLLAVSFSDGSLQLFDLENDAGSARVLEPGSGYTHFEGGFFQNYFAFSATGGEDSIFAVVDTATMEQTGGYQSAYPFRVWTDGAGICVQTENILVRIDPVTGDQTPLVTTSKSIRSFATDGQHTLIATPESFEFFSANALPLSAFASAGDLDLLQIAGGMALVANRSEPTLRLLRYESHSQEQLAVYDPAYAHDEVRLSADGQTVMLFSFDRFRICGLDGQVRSEVQIPDAQQVYDQQFRRQGDESWLEVIYYDGTRLRYDAGTGELLGQETGEPPDPELFEEFLTDRFRIESPLHGAPTVYDRTTGRQIAQLEGDAYLTYVTQTESGVILQYVTADGYFYGQLLDENCGVLAELPYLCDVTGDGTLLFDYPTGTVRCSRIFAIQELLTLAQETRDGAWTE